MQTNKSKGESSFLIRNQSREKIRRKHLKVLKEKTSSFCYTQQKICFKNEGKIRTFRYAKAVRIYEQQNHTMENMKGGPGGKKKWIQDGHRNLHSGMESTRNGNCVDVYVPVIRITIHCVYVLRAQSLSCVWLLAVPLTLAHQAPLSMGISRQEYRSGLPFPSPGDLPNSGVETVSLDRNCVSCVPCTGLLKTL